MSVATESIHVSIVAIPDVMMSTLSGLYDTLGSLARFSVASEVVPAQPRFRVEIVAGRERDVMTASGLPLRADRTLVEVPSTDVVIVPSLWLENGQWQSGRYPELVAWLREAHHRGAMLCSACSGVLIIGETGLLSGREATVHWSYAPTFRANFPDVELRLESMLVISGEREEFVMSGASASWHDLVLYLISRHAGPTAAQYVAKMLALQWHAEGQRPYMIFQPPRDHGDGVVARAQQWLERNFTTATPVTDVVRHVGMAERSFKRRFSRATGYSPIGYVQQLRIEDARRRLERTRTAIDEISFQIGYEDPAFFRRLFKRLTGMTPGAYRRKFSMSPWELGTGVAVGAQRSDRVGGKRVSSRVQRMSTES